MSLASMSHRSRPPKKPHRLRLAHVGLVVASVGSVFALAYMVQRAVQMVREGHGLDTYRTFWLVEFNWVGFFVFVVCALLALLVGFFGQWAQRRRERSEWRELDEKYGGRDAGA